jgi:hypothetical protein
MTSAFAQPVPIVAALLGLLFAGLVPTCLYLYVEPRGRLAWGAAGVRGGADRRAPLLVRAAAWASFAIGQLGVPWLAIPALCVGFLVLQAKLGLVRPVPAFAIGSLAAMGLVQALIAVRLIPLGVQLLMHSDRAWSRLRVIARTLGIAHGAVLAACALVGLGIGAVPGVVHPWLRTALDWAALRPVMACAVAGILHALLLDQCARVGAPSAGDETEG